MINILLEGYDIDAAWLYEGLQKYIKSNSKVVVIAFSFRGNRVRSVEDWNFFTAKRTENITVELPADFLLLVYLKATLHFLITLPTPKKLPWKK